MKTKISGMYILDIWIMLLLMGMQEEDLSPNHSESVQMIIEELEALPHPTLDHGEIN